MKLGLIRCLQTEDMCPATTDLKFIKSKKGAFEGISDQYLVFPGYFFTIGKCYR